MRVLKLGDINSPHLRRIVLGLRREGVEVAVFTLADPRDEWAKEHGVELHVQASGTSGSDLSKLRYLRAVPALRSLINRYRPDLVHAHYATSYGMLGALTGRRPLAISAWGSDVLVFPRKSTAHAIMLRWILRRADVVFSISKALTEACSRYAQVPIVQNPFGIDASVFRPGTSERPFPTGTLVFGTIKGLGPIYGTDVLLRSFARAVQLLPEVPLGLLICGDGPERSTYQDLSRSLGIADRTVLTGRLVMDQVPAHHRMIDVFANLSRSESFGVSVIEASATAVPVVATRVGGLPEVVIEGVTGLLVPVDDVEATAAAFVRLAHDPDLRAALGSAGRVFVLNTFDEHRTIRTLVDTYAQLLGIKDAHQA